MSAVLTTEQLRNVALINAASAMLKRDAIELHKEIKDHWNDSKYESEFGASKAPAGNTLYNGGVKSNASLVGEKAGKIFLDVFGIEPKVRDSLSNMFDDWKNLSLNDFNAKFLNNAIIRRRGRANQATKFLDGYVYYVRSQAFRDASGSRPTDDVAGYFIVERDAEMWKIVSAEAWYARVPFSLDRSERRGKWDGDRVAGTSRDILIVYQFRYDATNHATKHKDYLGLFAIQRRNPDKNASGKQEFEGMFYKLTDIDPNYRNDGDIVARRVFSENGLFDSTMAVSRAKLELLAFCETIRSRRE